MQCLNCGTNVPDSVKFCPSCGKNMSANAAPQPAPVSQQPVYAQSAPTNAAPPANPFSPPAPANAAPPAAAYMQSAPVGNSRPEQIPPQYRPLSPWAYFGYSLLFSIPTIGLIVLIVFSFSNDNINRRNFARSYFCAMLVLLCLAVLLVVIALIVAAVLGVGLTELFDDIYYSL